MKFSHVHVYEFFPLRVVSCTRAKLKPLTFKTSQKMPLNSNFNLFFLNMFMKISHLHVSELCHSRLVPCSIGAKVKPSTFQVSQNVQTNSVSFFVLLCEYSWNSLIYILCELSQSNPTLFTTPYHVMKRTT